MSNTMNEKQKALYDEWVQKDKELQASFTELRGPQLSTRRIAKNRALLEEYQKKIKELGD